MLQITTFLKNDTFSKNRIFAVFRSLRIVQEKHKHKLQQEKLASCSRWELRAPKTVSWPPSEHPRDSLTPSPTRAHTVSPSCLRQAYGTFMSWFGLSIKACRYVSQWETDCFILLVQVTRILWESSNGQISVLTSLWHDYRSVGSNLHIP